MSHAVCGTSHPASRPVRAYGTLGQGWCYAADAQGFGRAPWDRRAGAHRAGDCEPGRSIWHVDRLHGTQRQAGAVLQFLPRGAGPRHLINADVLKALGPKGYLINVARGSVVDEAALIDALQKGVIAGAGLDVFEKEPHVPAALWAMENVVLTPHIASGTWETRHAMADLAVANLRAHFAGQPLLSPVPEWR